MLRKDGAAITGGSSLGNPTCRLIRVVILRTPERTEVRWIGTSNVPLSPIVGQSELRRVVKSSQLRRVASSQDTHLENYIILSEMEGPALDFWSNQTESGHSPYFKEQTAITDHRPLAALVIVRVLLHRRSAAGWVEG